MNKVRISYDDFSDSMASLAAYASLNSLDNSENVRSICKILYKIIQEQLTYKEREALLLYYRDKINIPQISKNTERNKSTISRNKKRAENKIKNYMKYNNFRH